MQILIIGGGNMGATYAQSFVRSHITNKKNMMILEKSPEKAVELSTKDIGMIFGTPDQCIPAADLVILAVKPQDSDAVFKLIKPLVNDQQVFISIMAGVQIQTISEGLGIKKIVRAMPNLPAQIGMGMTAFTATDEVTRLELVMVQNLLNTTGKTLYVENERAIDATTAISGSGPAYVYFFMGAMVQAARDMGFTESESELLVNQTFSGALDLYSKSDLSCDEWISRVAPKGGTTEAALRSFEKNDLLNDIKSGAQAAFERAIELGKK